MRPERLAEIRAHHASGCKPSEYRRDCLDHTCCSPQPHVRDLLAALDEAIRERDEARAVHTTWTVDGVLLVRGPRAQIDAARRVLSGDLALVEGLKAT